MRCGHTRSRVPGEWNARYSHGFVTGYLCPDDTTAEEHAGAVIKRAVGELDDARLNNPGELGLADGLVQHVICVAADVWDALPARAVIDPNELVDETLDRLATTIGRPTGDNAVRERLAVIFRCWADRSEGPDGSWDVDLPEPEMDRPSRFRLDGVLPTRVAAAVLLIAIMATSAVAAIAQSDTAVPPTTQAASPTDVAAAVEAGDSDLVPGAQQAPLVDPPPLVADSLPARVAAPTGSASTSRQTHAVRRSGPVSAESSTDRPVIPTGSAADRRTAPAPPAGNAEVHLPAPVVGGAERTKADQGTWGKAQKAARKAEAATRKAEERAAQEAENTEVADRKAKAAARSANEEMGRRLKEAAN